MSITNLDIGKTFTLTKGAESLEGVLSSIITNPEVMENLNGDTQGSYAPSWVSGDRTITLDVQATAQNDDSTILSDITGATNYIIEGDIYTIHLIEIKGNKNSRTAFITLMHNQYNLVNPINPEIAITAILHLDENPANDYTLTGVVEGSNLELHQTPISGLFYVLTVKVYKYSNDDAYLNNIITNNTVFKKGITVTQNYEKNSQTETETFKSEKVVTLFDNLPVVTMNDRSSSTEVVSYSFKGGIERYITA
jgi:hypothetical protein